MGERPGRAGRLMGAGGGATGAAVAVTAAVVLTGAAVAWASGAGFVVGFGWSVSGLLHAPRVTSGRRKTTYRMTTSSVSA